MNQERPQGALSIGLAIFIVWISAAILSAYFGDTEQVIRYINSLSTSTVWYIILAYLAVESLWVFNWWFILRAAGYKARLRNLYPIVFSGFFIDNLTPAAIIGGEALSSYLVHVKEKVPITKSFASLMFQLVCWFLGFALFAISMFIALLFGNNLTPDTMYLFVPVIAIYGVFFGLFFQGLFDPASTKKAVDFLISKFYRFLQKIARKPEKDFRKEVFKWLSNFHKSMNMLARPRFLLAQGILTFFLIHVIETGVLYFILADFGYRIDYILLALLFSLTVFIGLLTMIPGGLGAMEISMASLLAGIGVPLEAAMPAVVIHRFLFYWVTNFIGGFFSVHYGISTILPHGMKLWQRRKKKN